MKKNLGIDQKLIFGKNLDNVQQSTPNVVNFLKYSVFLTLKIIQFKFTLKTKCKKFVTRETCHRGGGSKFHAGEMEQNLIIRFLVGSLGSLHNQ